MGGIMFASRKWDSNPRPTHYECVALPTEPFRQIVLTKDSIRSIYVKVKRENEEIYQKI